ncbi:MAG: hypothetical protein HS130_05000 [Deltaproteobacteria bacterium]|nr:hypothetical protein [Deltaproteobacteria bacterium]MCL4874391.1 hypothetical protein [bacterium]
MKRLLFFASAAAMMMLSTDAAYAVPSENLLTNGDFQDGTPIAHSDFNPSTGPFNIWLGPGDVSIQENGTGKSAGDFFAAFELPADPTELGAARLVQGIDLNPGDIPPGTPLFLGFDFFPVNGSPAELNLPEIAKSELYVLGLNDSDGPVRVSPFTGDGFPPGDVIFSQNLLNLTSLRNQWVSAGAGFPINQEYDFIAVVFNAEGLGSLRGDLAGVDNVSLRKNVQAPEPGTFFLIGSAISAIIMARHRIKAD